MSRPSEGVRLRLRSSRVRKSGAVEPAMWLIRDGKHEESTGCSPDRLGYAEAKRQADIKLAAYFTKRHNPRSAGDPASKGLADALAVYKQDVMEIPPGAEDSELTARQREDKQRIIRLNLALGDRLIVSLAMQDFKDYAKGRPPQAARRDLEVLRAALNYYAKRGFISIVPYVWLPEKAQRRERFITKPEAARLLRAAWRMRQTYGKDGKETERRIGIHLARFLIIGFYSGTRRTAMSTAALEFMPGHPYFDLDLGLFYRTPRGAKKTKKNMNQGVQRVAPSLLAHLRRWKRLGARFAVEWRGHGVKKINKAFRHACELAGLGEDVVPHTLRHSLVTWMLQAGRKTWDVAEFVGMDEATVREHYGHFCLDHQQGAANYAADAREKRRIKRGKRGVSGG